MEYLNKENPKKLYHFFRQREYIPLYWPIILNFNDNFKELSSSDRNTCSDQDFTPTKTDNLLTLNLIVQLYQRK